MNVLVLSNAPSSPRALLPAAGQPRADAPQATIGPGSASSRDSNFQQFQCIGAGGRWNGSNCLEGPKSNTIINP